MNLFMKVQWIARRGIHLYTTTPGISNSVVEIHSSWYLFMSQGIFNFNTEKFWWALQIWLIDMPSSQYNGNL